MLEELERCEVLFVNLANATLEDFERAGWQAKSGCHTLAILSDNRGEGSKIAAGGGRETASRVSLDRPECQRALLLRGHTQRSLWSGASLSWDLARRAFSFSRRVSPRRAPRLSESGPRRFSCGPTGVRVLLPVLQRGPGSARAEIDLPKTRRETQRFPKTALSVLNSSPPPPPPRAKEKRLCARRCEKRRPLLPFQVPPEARRLAKRPAPRV